VHGISLLKILFLALGTQLVVTIGFAVLFIKERVAALCAGNGNRFIIGNPFAGRISGTGIKRFSLFGTAFHHVPFSALRALDVQTYGTGIFALGIGGTGDEFTEPALAQQ
jgi:hypothetical protein